jgi:tryptophan 2,3-dioxygenase
MNDDTTDPSVILKRELEDGIKTQFVRDGDRHTYADFLKLDVLLDLQETFQDPPERDELLFIMIHQVCEMWLKLMHFELQQIRNAIATDNLNSVHKSLARVKAILQQLIGAWQVLQTMTVSDYIAFRDALGAGSGFQSWGYRLVEFALGNKDANHIKMHRHDPAVSARLEAALAEPALYDEVLAMLKRNGWPVPDRLLERDVSEPYGGDDEIVAIWAKVYSDPEANWDLYDLAEKLMDVEGLFQRWRFDHMSTVQRIIGHHKGTGGSSGVGYLKAALSLRFFHDLYEVRNVLVQGDY